MEPGSDFGRSSSSLIQLHTDVIRVNLATGHGLPDFIGGAFSFRTGKLPIETDILLERNSSMPKDRWTVQMDSVHIRKHLESFHDYLHERKTPSRTVAPDVPHAHIEDVLRLPRKVRFWLREKTSGCGAELPGRDFSAHHLALKR